MTGFIAVGIGAMLGAWLRWGLGIWGNELHTHLPLGTLAANLLGGYLVGLAVAFFHSHPSIAPEWKLFIITGFLGGLTTFSSFSAESVLLMQRGEYLWAFGHTALHLGGSIACCIAGFASYRAIAA